MAIYEFDCETCQVRYEKEAPMTKPAKRLKCPQCKKMCQKVFYAAPLIFKGKGWYINRLKFRKQFDDKQTITNFYRDSMEASKKRMKTGFEHYSRMTPNYEVLEKEGRVKRKSDTKAREDLRNAKDVGINLKNKHEKDKYKPI